MFRQASEIENELEQYDCETCEIRARVTALDADNARAWGVWQRVAHRVVVDLQAGGYVLSLALADLPPDDALACVERLSVIYDVLSPPPAQKE